jgi:hypothetical protein
VKKLEVKTVEVSGFPAAQRAGQNAGPFETAVGLECLLGGWEPWYAEKLPSGGYLVMLKRTVES